jgi:copper chaperone CopZ
VKVVPDEQSDLERREKMAQIILDIPNISCNHCIMTVKREAGFVDGAEFVSGDIEAKTATFEVQGDDALASLKQTLTEAGYPPN